MERLTNVKGDYIDFTNCKHNCGKCVLEKCVECDTHKECFDKLAEYEDTGLTPNEVTQTQKENAELKELLRMAVEGVKSLSCSTGLCRYCTNSTGYANKCKLGKTINGSFCADWQWQHADRAREVGVEYEN